MCVSLRGYNLDTFYTRKWKIDVLLSGTSAFNSEVKLASCKSALNPTVVYSTGRSKAVVPVLVLLFVA